MLTVYGPARSRASRVLWMLEECGMSYDHEDLTRYPTMEEKAAAVRQVYPMGKVPFIVDDGRRLSESMAINLHLARKCGRDLWPEDEWDQAQAMQWSFFAVAEVDPPMVQLMIERSFRKEPDRSPENEKKNAELIKRPLKYLDGHLEGRQWLIGDRFTVADLNLASIFTMAGGAKVDLDEYPNVRDWVARCFDRPAHKRASAQKQKT